MKLLLVEDNPGDVTLVRIALGRTGVECELVSVGDGDAALRYLRRGEEFADAVRPDLILLDLNIPRVHGHEVLRLIKSEAALVDIPVLIYSSTTRTDDIRKSYELHANGMIAKCFDPDDLERTMAAVLRYWGTVNVAPPPAA